jgi:hypothetical protein
MNSVKMTFYSSEAIQKKCDECNKKYRIKEHLKNHIYYLHLEQRQVLLMKRTIKETPLKCLRSRRMMMKRIT